MLETIVLRVAEQTLTVELAVREPDRIRGLMFRKFMPNNHGMLFVFKDDDVRSFWMLNTYLPLDIAYLDATGVILNIHAMEPLDITRQYPSAGKARYALEVNQGWFAERGVVAGDTCAFELPDTLAIDP